MSMIIFLILSIFIIYSLIYGNKSVMTVNYSETEEICNALFYTKKPMFIL